MQNFIGGLDKKRHDILRIEHNLIIMSPTRWPCPKNGGFWTELFGPFLGRAMPRFFKFWSGFGQLKIGILVIKSAQKCPKSPLFWLEIAGFWAEQFGLKFGPARPNGQIFLTWPKPNPAGTPLIRSIKK